jgi:hypothetical protein
MVSTSIRTRHILTFSADFFQYTSTRNFSKQSSSNSSASNGPSSSKKLSLISPTSKVPGLRYVPLFQPTTSASSAENTFSGTKGKSPAFKVSDKESTSRTSSCLNFPILRIKKALPLKEKRRWNTISGRGNALSKQLLYLPGGTETETSAHSMSCNHKLLACKPRLK